MKVVYKRVCPVCGREFETERPHGKYDRPACKEKAYRERQRAKIAKLIARQPNENRAKRYAKLAKLTVVDWHHGPATPTTPIIGTAKARRFQELVCLGVYDGLPA